MMLATTESLPAGSCVCVYFNHCMSLASTVDLKKAKRSCVAHIMSFHFCMLLISLTCLKIFYPDLKSKCRNLCSCAQVFDPKLNAVDGICNMDWW